MHVLCASFAPDYARKGDDFSAVMVLPEETMGMGGKVGEGHGGASGAEDGAGGEGGHAVAHSGGDGA